MWGDGRFGARWGWDLEGACLRVGGWMGGEEDSSSVGLRRAVVCR